MSSRRLPLATYSAKRRQRSISNPHSRPIPSSSPLKPVAHDADLTVEEMSRRMMKRSRNGLKRAHSGPDAQKPMSAGASPVERMEDARPAKRSKASARVPLATKSTQNLLFDVDGSIDMELTDVTGGMLTPAPHGDGTAKQKQDDTIMNEKSDFLSPLPSSRTSKRVMAHRSSSKNLKENATAKKISNNNMLMTPASSDLGSPFSSRPGSPNITRSSAKKSLNKKLNRTRSVGTDLRRRATTRSFSRAVSPASNVSSPGIRRPSLPSANNGQNENQNWAIPVKFKQSYGQVVPRRPSETGVPFARESSFFTGIPEACSTPQAPKRISVMIPPTPGRDIDATPRMPPATRSSAPFSNSKDQGIFMMDEPTPRASTNKPTSALTRTEDSIFPDTIPEHDEEGSISAISKPSLPQNGRRRMTVHMSQDSIFSSAMDFSTSITERRPISNTPQITDRTKVQPESVTLAPPSSPMVGHISPVSSEGDELRDMFSILGLDEDDHWFLNSIPEADNGASASTNSKKKKSTLSLRRGDLKQDIIGAKGRAMRTNGQAAGSSSTRAPSTQKRVLIMADSPPQRQDAKKATSKQHSKGWPRPTIKMRILDKAIQPASDSSDELNLLKRRMPRGDDSTA